MADVLIRLSRQTLALLREDAALNDMPKRGGTHTEFDGQNGQATHVVNYEDHFRLFERNANRLSLLDSWVDALSYLSSDSGLHGRKSHPERDLRGMLSDLVNRHGLNPTSRQIARIVNNHLSMWQSGKLVVSEQLALVGVVPGVERCVLGPGVEIRLLNTKLLNRFWNEDAASFSLMPTGFASYKVLSARYLLTASSTVDRDEPSILWSPPTLRSVENAIVALRLAAVGAVGAAATRRRYIPKPAGVSGSAVQEPQPPLSTWASAKDVELNRTTCRRASLLYRKLTMGVPSGFQMALRRFSSSFERRENEDAVVDLAIALEASLLHGIDSELSYRIQILAASLLRHETLSVARSVRDLYSVRSKIVHGARLLKDVVKVSPQEYVNAARQLVAKILSAYLQELSTGKSMDKIRDELQDHAIMKLESLDR